MTDSYKKEIGELIAKEKVQREVISENPTAKPSKYRVAYMAKDAKFRCINVTGKWRCRKDSDF